MTYGHLQADCLYTGISSGPNARCRVWEAFTFTFNIVFRVNLMKLFTEETRVANIHIDSAATHAKCNQAAKEVRGMKVTKRTFQRREAAPERRERRRQ